MDVSPKYLDPVEKLLDLSIGKQEWDKTLKWVALLKEKTLNPDHWERIDQAMKRLESGINASGNKQ
jgi:hypothetical protein